MEKIKITNKDLFRVTRVRDQVILFDYDGKHYLINGCYEPGEGDWQDFYERKLNDIGRYTLKYLNTCLFAREYVVNDYIKPQRGVSIVYKNIDKDYFIEKLVKNGFAEVI